MNGNIDIFARARSVPAEEVARAAGLTLKRSGGRSWTCCPLHGEKTASLCFYPDGSWYCFGCGAGGDSTQLHSLLHNVDRLTAARMIVERHGVGSLVTIQAKPKHKPYLEGADGGLPWEDICKQYHEANDKLHAEKGDTPALWDALEARSRALEQLDNIIAGEERHG